MYITINKTKNIANISATVAFIMAALLFQIVAKAQSTTDEDDLRPMIGIKGGVNLSNFIFSNDEVTDKNILVTPMAGVFFKAPITSAFAIQPELLWTNSGSSVTYQLGSGSGISPGDGSVKFILSYIQLPVLAVFNISKYFNIHGGVYASYLFSAKLSNQSQNTSYNSFNDLNTDDFNKIDYGLAGGIGFDIRPLVFGVRYNYGLRTINNSTLSDIIAKDARNSNLNIYIGIGF